MIRQRINLRTPVLAHVVRVLTFVLALALIWYGLMVVLLAVKVSPHTVNSISAYRTLYNDAAGIHPGDFTTTRRLIFGFGGLLAFLVFTYLALQELPRPYLARGEVTLDEQPRGVTKIEPRAFERVAELAAAESPDVTAAAGRLGDEELSVNIGVRRAGASAESLKDVHRRVAAGLERHELPSLPVNVTLTSYDRKTRRELS
jgi:hypothetical protein